MRLPSIHLLRIGTEPSPVPFFRMGLDLISPLFSGVDRIGIDGNLPLVIRFHGDGDLSASTITLLGQLVLNLEFGHRIWKKNLQIVCIRRQRSSLRIVSCLESAKHLVVMMIWEKKIHQRSEWIYSEIRHYKVIPFAEENPIYCKLCKRNFIERLIAIMSCKCMIFFKL